MTTTRKFLGLLCLILVATNLHAANIPLQNLNDDDMKKVAGDMSANFLHSSVSGANTLGTIWGFEVGVVANQTSTPNLNDVVHKADASANADKLYNAALLGALSIPFGITGEIGILPAQKMSGVTAGSTSLAVKWSLTETLLSDLPFSLAVKGSYSKADVKFNQTVSVSGTPTPIDYKLNSETTALTVLVSKNLMILEPYAGVGMVNGKANMDATATSVFASGATSGSGAKSGTMFMVGTEIKLLVIKFGLEYANVMGDSRLGGKFSLFF